MYTLCTKSYYVLLLAAEAGDLRYGFLFVPTVYLLLLIVVDLPFFAFASSLYLKLRFR